MATNRERDRLELCARSSSAKETFAKPVGRHASDTMGGSAYRLSDALGLRDSDRVRWHRRVLLRNSWLYDSACSAQRGRHSSDDDERAARSLLGDEGKTLIELQR